MEYIKQKIETPFRKSRGKCDKYSDFPHFLRAFPSFTDRLDPGSHIVLSDPCEDDITVIQSLISEINKCA